MGLVNISIYGTYMHLETSISAANGEWSKKSVQQGRSPFAARSVRPVREHGKMARTLLAAFFNIPNIYPPFGGRP